jgi:putative endonuclease
MPRSDMSSPFGEEVNIMTKKSLKQRGEDAAAAYLERVGICVVERTWSCDAGVVDIVAFDGDTLVVVDVKTSQAAGQKVSQAVSAAMTGRIRRIAEAYIEFADLHDVQWRLDRIDLLIISEDRALLRHHRDATSIVN